MTIKTITGIIFETIKIIIRCFLLSLKFAKCVCQTFFFPSISCYRDISSEMLDVCPAGIYKKLTSDSAPHVSLCIALWVEHLIGNQGLTGSINVSDSEYFLSIQREEHILFLLCNQVTT